MSYHPQSPSRDSDTINKKRKRISHESEELAWTAARCSRLLRSITHRIGALRKLAGNPHTEERMIPKRTTVEKRAASHWSTQDPVWMGDAKRKTGAKTFAGKKKAIKQPHAQKAANESFIAFPSPFVRRVVLGGDVSPEVPFVRPALPPSRLTRQLPIKAASPRIEAENGLLSAFESVLSATKGCSPRLLHGSRSLMSTCLRNVPRYITINEDDDEHSNFSSEIMSYLEEYGTKENGGWSGLREVVRSQAMQAICEAIGDGILSETITKDFLHQCGKQDWIPEGQEILCAWICSREAVTPKQIETLINFGREQRCEAFVFRLMRRAIEQDSTKLAGFCKSPGFWKNLLRSLAGASPYEAAALLSISVKFGLEQEINCSQGLGLGLKETMLKLIAMAASSTLLNNAQSDPGKMAHIVHSLAADAIFSNASHLPGELHSLLISCSMFILSVSPNSSAPFDSSDLSVLLPSTSSKTRPSRFNFAADIISSAFLLGQDLNSDLIGPLLERMTQQANVAPLYKQIAFVALTTKQEVSACKDTDVLLAEVLNELIPADGATMGKTPRTPGKPLPVGFRWEEGLCEWVTKTPFAAVETKPPTPVAVPSLEDKENRAPSRAECCKSTQRERCVPLNSPDVLAFSPRSRKVEESPLRPRQGKRARLSQTRGVMMRKEVRSRTSRLPLGCRLVGEDSADELGF